MDPKLVHSFSSLEMFDGCPKRFYHLRVAKDYKPEDSEASLAGTRDHKAFEDRINLGTELPDYLKKHEGKVELLLNSGYEVTAEKEFAITRNFEPCENWWHPDVFLRVKADVVVRGETRAAVLDWKTGKRRPKPFQLELAAMTMLTSYPMMKSTEAAFLWLREESADKYKYTRDDLDRIKTKLMTKVEKIEETAADGVWQAKPGYHCNWCEVKNDCSYSQARG